MTLLSGAKVVEDSCAEDRLHPPYNNHRRPSSNNISEASYATAKYVFQKLVSFGAA